MNDQLADFVTMVTAMLNGDQAALQQFSDAPADVVDAATSDVPAEDIDPMEVLSQALAGSDLPADQQAAVMDAVNESVTGYGAPEGGYSPEQLADIFAQGINITVEEGDEIYVDNSLYVEGDVKGGIHQANVTDITQADDGAIIADGAQGSNFQTGEGNVQLDNVNADNITTGSGNTVGSDGAVIGNENVNAGHIDNSEFGEGDQDRSLDIDADVDGSFNESYKSDYYSSDDDVVKTDVDVAVDGGGHYPEPKPYEPIKPVETYDDPHYDEPAHDDVYDG